MYTALTGRMTFDDWVWVGGCLCAWVSVWDCVGLWVFCVGVSVDHVSGLKKCMCSCVCLGLFKCMQIYVFFDADEFDVCWCMCPCRGVRVYTL